MKAAVVERYGEPDVVRVMECARPAPRRGEILVRVEAVAVTAGDARIRAARFPRGFSVPARLAFGLRRPRRPILGSAFSGIVDSVAPDVTTFAPGDEIAGMNGIRMGMHAQYAVAGQRSVVRKPETVSHEDAAGALFGGTTARHFVRDRVPVGAKVLVNGASGAVGTSAVQLAAALGGVVTAVTSTRNSALVRELGAASVVDYRESAVSELTETYDLVIDAVGNISRAVGLRLVGDHGTLVLAVAGLGDMIRARGRVVAGSGSERADDISALLDMIAGGSLAAVTEVLGGLEAIPEAYRRIDSGRKVGNLVVRPWA